MTSPVEHDLETPKVHTAELASSPPVLQILGDPGVGVCVDGVCEVPDLNPDEHREEHR